MSDSVVSRVMGFIEENALLSGGDSVLVALSGGSDSVFALRFFQSLSEILKIKISACHLNHSLRGGESDGDEEFCRNLCGELNVPFISKKVQVKHYATEHKNSIEEAARIIRYQFFEEAAENFGAGRIITAHNMSDNAETLLLNLSKGTGIRGLSGIPIRRGRIIRPLLCLSKDEIENYCRLKEWDFRVDRTNFDTDIERNFLRHSIIPLLKKSLNPELERSLMHSSLIMRETVSIIEASLKPELELNAFVESDGLRLRLHSAGFTGEFLRASLMKAFGRGITYRDFIKIRSLAASEAGRSEEISGGLKAVRDRDCLRIYPKQAVEPEAVEIAPGKRVLAFGFEILIEIIDEGIVDAEFSESAEIISADNIGNIFILRRWNCGDKFIPLGMRGFKKVSDFLRDEKIPPSRKRDYPVLTNNGTVVLIPGIRIDERFKVNKNTRRLCKIWIQKQKK